ncbi:MAG: hypothetical protein PHP57_13905 [Sideroxydans sp.]|nr:hypothetical protein [Sideroxydans sp.]
MLNAAGFKCAACGDTEETLHVHHKHYKKGCQAWEYSDSELVVLCDCCHQNEHESIDLIKNLAGSIPAQHRSDLISILAGIAFATTGDNRLTDNPSICPLMLMSGMVAIKCNELDLTGIGNLTNFLKVEIEKSITRKSINNPGVRS